MIPGEVITPETDIELNVGRETLKVVVANLGDSIFRSVRISIL